ncbi:MAG: GNAT family N-acetyltransferase [Henriciella sp.]
MTARPEFTRLSRAQAAAMSALHAVTFRPEETWSEATFDALLAQETTLAIGLIQDEDLFAMLVAQMVTGDAEILTLATHPAARRRGYAAGLLTHCEQNGSVGSLERWLLDVAADNHSAIDFYEKLGFRRDGRRANYYKRLEGDRVDAILMSKRLAGQAGK